MDDAVFACHFYEEIITSQSGYSYLGVEPVLHVVGGTLDQVLGRENDRNMREFGRQLRSFVKEYCGNEEDERDVSKGIGEYQTSQYGSGQGVHCEE